MKNRFLSLDPWRVGETLLLDQTESHHLLKVFRSEIGEELQLINGKGGLAEARLVGVKKGIAEVKIEAINESKQSSGVHLVFSLPKGQALDVLIHHCTQLGVKSLQPVISAHSAIKSGWNEERWNRVMIEVSKQCQETHFPQLLAPLNLSDWLAARKSRPLWVCLESARDKTDTKVDNNELDVVIGPEGGWSREEEEKFRSVSGFLAFGLGKNRLRAETAAITAVILAKRHRGEL